MKSGRQRSKRVEFGLIAGIAAVFLTISIAVAALLIEDFGSIFTREHDSIPIAGQIEFSGGIDYGDNLVYVNPTSAQPVAVDYEGFVAESLNWWIIKAGETDILYRSEENDDLDHVLSYMCDYSPQGLYVLQFRVETVYGESFRVGRNFYIIPYT
jgi:hypothetical protein